MCDQLKLWVVYLPRWGPSVLPTVSFLVAACRMLTPMIILESWSLSKSPVTMTVAGQSGKQKMTLGFLLQGAPSLDLWKQFGMFGNTSWPYFFYFKFKWWFRQGILRSSSNAEMILSHHSWRVLILSRNHDLLHCQYDQLWCCNQFCNPPTMCIIQSQILHWQ